MDSDANLRGQRADPVLTDSELESIGIDDPVRMYLREIGRHGLLSAERETHLARTLERGEYLQSLLKRLGAGDDEPTGYELGLLLLADFERSMEQIE